MEEMRRIIEQLQRRLERYERQTPPRREAHHADEEEEDINPLHNEDDSSDDAYPRRRQRYHRGREADVKIVVPEFDRKMQGDVFLDWLYTVERIFEGVFRGKEG